MPVHNKVFLHQNKKGKSQFHRAPLLTGGPVLAVEVQIPSALALHMTSKNQPLPTPVTGVALIDTGATRSCVDNSVISGLGVQPVNIMNVLTANGKVQQHTYPAKLVFPADKFEVEFADAIGVDLGGQTAHGQSIIALIGRDLLSEWLFVYNGPLGTFSIAM